jgi:ACS family tartrate transporter-like MFS transporter
LTDDERTTIASALREEGPRSRAGAPAGTNSVVGALVDGRIWLLSVVYFTIPLALYAMGFWLPQIIKAESTGSDFKIGLMAAIPYVVGGAGMVGVARHSDRMGERRWHIAGAALVGGAAFVLSAFAHSLIGSLAAFSLAMLGLASMFGPFWAFATSTVTGVGAATAIALINAIGNTGGFAGPSLIGYIRDRTHDFAGGLIAVGIVLALVPLVVMMLPEDGP